ncbi:growth regulator [Zoogloea sp. LCSB751]|uniref:AbrB/MazE/SpoVT family DNA-binding domain-containing protein n=1 Tax=Zoogloea sp. LCSB751 TaxID=1965277 RepID=UPI0009A5255A|nr:growth regulator [Zoogloea sp. LCSB751]
MRQANKRADDAFVLTAPRSFMEQNGISEGDHLELGILGGKISAQIAARPRYKVTDLLAEMPDGLPRVEENWDATQDVGLEKQ